MAEWTGPPLLGIVPHPVLRIGAVLLLVYLLAAVTLWWVADRFIFLPQAPGYAATGELLRLPSADGETIAAVWLPNPQARHAVLFSHGNAEDLGDARPFLDRLRVEGFSVLAYDYPGYGASTGRPTEAGAYRAAEAAYAHLVDSLGIAPERIVLHGRSLGGAVAVELAARRPAAGVILESTFTSASRVGFGARIFPFDRFESIRKVGGISTPTLVLHGLADGVIPAHHGRTLLRGLAGRTDSLFVAGAGHNDLAHVAGERYWAALRDFAAGLPAG